MFIVSASVVLLLYIVSSGFFIAVVTNDKKKLATLGVLAIGAGMLVHLASLALLVSGQGFGSLLNIQHSLSVLALLLGVGFFVVRKLYQLHTIGSFVVPLMMLLQAVAVLAEPETAVDPEWRGTLLMLHITCALLGTASFVLAALTSAFYLIQDHNLRRKKFGPLFNRLPSVDVLDRANVRLITVGFPIYTVGIGLGAYWAWSSTSSLQVQYLFAMLSWLIYAAILQARITIGWRGRRAAMLTLLGLVGLGAVLSSYLVRSTQM